MEKKSSSVNLSFTLLVHTMLLTSSFMLVITMIMNVYNDGYQILKLIGINL